jgi:hypothetical protein
VVWEEVGVGVGKWQRASRAARWQQGPRFARADLERYMATVRVGTTCLFRTSHLSTTWSASYASIVCMYEHYMGVGACHMKHLYGSFRPSRSTV